MTLKIVDATAMEAFGARLAQAGAPGDRIYLQGDLGAGKTTLVRGFLREKGYKDIVKSPTYTLIESYPLQPIVHHFDFYRVNDPGELEAIGLRDYLDEVAICLVEWPERGMPILPVPDLTVHFRIDGRERRLSLQAHGERGEALVRQITV